VSSPRRRADIAGGKWIATHKRIVRVIDGDLAGVLVVGGVAEAVIRAVRET
jgi:hypothetical protein